LLVVPEGAFFAGAASPFFAFAGARRVGVVAPVVDSAEAGGVAAVASLGVFLGFLGTVLEDFHRITVVATIRK
jgi:hypothetical protein